MDETIETERLLLRPFVEADAPRVLQIHQLDEVIRWLGEQPYRPMADLDEALAYVARWREIATTMGPYDIGYAVEVKETGVLAGCAMIVPLPKAENEERQIGWYLHPDSTGRGYATEAARAVLDAVFAAGLDQVWCDMFPDNEPSAALARRLGLREIGLVDDPWYGDRALLFHSTAEEWLS